MHFLQPLVSLPLLFSIASSFDPREATISSTHHSLYTGLTTCREVVSSFLSRIETLNNRTNAVLTLNPSALNIADHYDEQLSANNGSYGPLFCIPILLKDNYGKISSAVCYVFHRTGETSHCWLDVHMLTFEDTTDMPTTGGNLALAKSQPTVDAPTVRALKNAGAVVLGKANLHELALEGLSVSSLGGQTINPYDYTRTPGGSSGGTG